MKNRVLRKTDRATILGIRYKTWRVYIINCIEIYACLQNGILILLQYFSIIFVASLPIGVFVGLSCAYASNKISSILNDIENNPNTERHRAESTNRSSKNLNQTTNDGNNSYVTKLLNSIKITSRLFICSYLIGIIGAILLFFQPGESSRAKPFITISLFNIGMKLFLIGSFVCTNCTLFYYLHSKLLFSGKKAKNLYILKTKQRDSKLISKNINTDMLDKKSKISSNNNSRNASTNSKTNSKVVDSSNTNI